MAKNKKLTLEDKKLLNDHVTGETKRCLSILNKLKDAPGMALILQELAREMIEGSPYIKYHPELLKRIPE